MSELLWLDVQFIQLWLDDYPCPGLQEEVRLKAQNGSTKASWTPKGTIWVLF